MLTVPEVAKRTGRNPETIRRWIRAGKLRARKVGTQHVVEEQDLDALQHPDTLSVPQKWGWGKTFWGGRMPDAVGLIRRQRESH
jgi:excisionase family DNA binding protein